MPAGDETPFRPARVDSVLELRHRSDSLVLGCRRSSRLAVSRQRGLFAFAAFLPALRPTASAAHRRRESARPIERHLIAPHAERDPHDRHSRAGIFSRSAINSASFANTSARVGPGSPCVAIATDARRRAFARAMCSALGCNPSIVVIVALADLAGRPSPSARRQRP